MNEETMQTAEAEGQPETPGPVTFAEYKEKARAGEEPAAETAKKADSEATETGKAESAGEAEPPETEIDEEGKPTRKPKAEARIRELTRKRREAEAERDSLRQQLEELKSSKQQPKTEERSGNKQPAKPKADDFADYDKFEEAMEAYREALIEYKVDQRLKAKTEAEQADKTAAELNNSWEQRSAEARQVHDDFDEALAANEIDLPGHVMQSILESKQGAELAYHLAKNPQELQEIVELSPLAAVRRLGAIEATLTPASKIEAPKTSKAPPPAKPLGAGKSASRAEDVKDFATYKKLRMAESAG